MAIDLIEHRMIGYGMILGKTSKFPLKKLETWKKCPRVPQNPMIYPHFPRQNARFLRYTDFEGENHIKWMMKILGRH